MGVSPGSWDPSPARGEGSLGSRFGGGVGVASKSGVSLSTLGGVRWVGGCLG